MGRVGLVVGATRDEAAMRRVHDAAPAQPWLVPGVGAQGGSVTAVRDARPGVAHPAHTLVHATRSLMPGPGESIESIRAKADALHSELASALGAPRTHEHNA